MLIYRILFFMILANLKLLAQSYISDKDWEYHLNLTDINHLALFNNNIYCFASLGLYSVDLLNNSISRNLDALDVTDLSISATYSDSNYFVLGTSNGNIEILSSDQKTTLSLSDNKSHVKINSIFLHEENLYVATSSGLFNISLDQFFVKEIYKRFNESDEKSTVTDIAVFNNKIYIISSNRVYFFDLINQNPMDFNFWEEIKFNNDTPIGLFVWNNEILFYSINSIYDENQQKIFSNSDIKIKKLKESGEYIYMLYLNNGNEDMIGYLDSNKLNSITISDEIDYITDFIIVEDNLWISGQNFGLFNLIDKTFYTLSNSIKSDFKNISSINNAIYAFSDSNIVSYKEGSLDWENFKIASFSKITSIENHNNKLFFASNKYGIFNYAENKIINHLSKNSLLKMLPNGDIHVPDIKSRFNKLWILNYGSDNPLLSFDGQDEWMMYDIDSQSEVYPKQFEFVGNDIWISLDSNRGGGIIVYNIFSDEITSLSVSNGKLISNYINDLKVDNSGNLWIATDEGLVYYPPLELNNYNYVIPNDGNSYLFKGVKINSLDIDYSNNVWIGSDNGLFISNNEDNKLIYQFNENNSPLLSDSIRDIKSNEIGRTYILSNLGLQSINTSVLKPKFNLNELKIYPNPLKLKEHDRLYFSGLTLQSKIKIVSLSGDIITQFVVDGGGFSWNLLSSQGNKINEGIYLIFIVSQDGNEDLIGKILVL